MANAQEMNKSIQSVFKKLLRYSKEINSMLSYGQAHCGRMVAYSVPLHALTCSYQSSNHIHNAGYLTFDSKPICCILYNKNEGEERLKDIAERP